METNCGLKKGRGKDWEGQELGRPDDVGISKMGEDVVRAEFGFVWREEWWIHDSSVVVEFVE